jgi:uncharacterized protein involved in exopolysaccharide biosynthesis
MVGIDLSSGGADPSAVAVLRSRMLVREFLRTNHDAEKDLRMELAKGALYRLRRLDADHVDQREVVRMFDERIRSVTQDKRTGLFSLVIRWTDPQMAAKWANSYVELANTMLRYRALALADSNVAFLRKQLEESRFPAIQQSTTKILEAEIQKEMMARGNAEYAFRIVDPATSPIRHSSPRGSLIVLAGAFVGAFVFFGLVLMRSK